MRMAESDTALLESFVGGDASAGKETRDFAPFIDQLDIDELMTGVDELVSRLKSAAMPQSGPLKLPASGMPDARSEFASDLGPLMKTPLPAAPNDPESFAGIEPPPVIEALTIEISPASRAAIAVEKGAAASGIAGASARVASVREEEPDKQADVEQDVLARIVQLADVDESTEVTISVTAGEGADIVVTADTDIDLVQNARIDIEVATGKPLNGRHEQAEEQADASLPEDRMPEDQVRQNNETASDLPHAEDQPSATGFVPTESVRAAAAEPGAEADDGTAMAQAPASPAGPNIDAAAGTAPLAPLPSAPEPLQQAVSEAPAVALIDHDGVSEFSAHLAQDIDIDTIVHVDVNGFAGEVIIDTRISEEADVRQDVRPTISLSGDEDGFDINISQLLDIDLLSDVDIEIVETGGRLYLTIAIKDNVEGTDLATVDIADGADEWLDVDLIQSADIDQRLTVSVDLEQELAALFDIDVDVDAELDIDVAQSGDVRIGLSPGEEIDVGFDGESEIDLMNHIHIRIDFTPQ